MSKLLAALMFMPILALSGQQPAASGSPKTIEAIPADALASQPPQSQIASAQFVASQTIGFVSAR